MFHAAHFNSGISITSVTSTRYGIYAILYFYCHFWQCLKCTLTLWPNQTESLYCFTVFPLTFELDPVVQNRGSINQGKVSSFVNLCFHKICRTKCWVIVRPIHIVFNTFVGYFKEYFCHFYSKMSMSSVILIYNCIIKM